MTTKWTEPMLVELCNLFHLAKTALAGRGKQVTRYDQKLWASREFHKVHPEISSTAAYKALCREDAWRF